MENAKFFFWLGSLICFLVSFGVAVDWVQSNFNAWLVGGFVLLLLFLFAPPPAYRRG